MLRWLVSKSSLLAFAVSMKMSWANGVGATSDLCHMGFLHKISLR